MHTIWINLNEMNIFNFNNDDIIKTIIDDTQDEDSKNLDFQDYPAQSFYKNNMYDDANT